MNKTILALIVGILTLIPSVLAASIFTNVAFDTVLIAIVVIAVFLIIKNMLKVK